MNVKCIINRQSGGKDEVWVKCRIDTLDEVEYYRHGGILLYVLRNMLSEAA